MTLAAAGLAGGVVAFSMATSGVQVPAMSKDLTRLVWYAIRV